jgi:serine/threonine-protein kinase HipA
VNTRALDVWLYGTRLAELTESASGKIELAWTSDAVERWGPGARLLSAKLSIGDTPVSALVRTYVDGLLPEGNARTNHALSAGVAPDDTFGLIRAYGHDTLGAAIFTTPGEGDPTNAGHYEKTTEEVVADRLLRADEHSPAGAGTIVESSTLPGMVPKITLHREKGSWFTCKDGAASTWIIKRAQSLDSDLADVVDTEVACLDLARRMGLTTVEAEIFATDAVRGIAVSRYDRTADRTRIHQEDLAQAIGLNTADPNRKFQWGSAMPSLRQGADVLRLDGSNPDDLLRLAVFSHLVGNTDMHAKNVSFIRHDNGSVSLSPAYDIAMHLHHPRDNRRSALDVNHKSAMTEIALEDFLREGLSWGLPARRARSVVARTIVDLAGALTEINREDHGGVSTAAWDLVTERVEQFRAQAGADASTPTAEEVPRRRRRGPRAPH